MKKLMNVFMLSCKKATELIEKKLCFKLNIVESVQLLVHTSMCHACKTYEKQSKVIDNVLQKNINTPHIHTSEKPTKNFKDRIKNKIKNM